MRTLDEIRHSNTLHGFNPYADDGFIIGLIGNELDTSALTHRLRAVTGSKTVYFGDWIGRGYMAIRREERALIPAVINALLDAMVLQTPDSPPCAPDGYVYYASYQPGVVKATQLFNMIDALGHVFKPITQTYPPNITNSITLQTTLGVTYTAGEAYSLERSEEKFVDYWHKTFDDPEMRRCGFSQHVLRWSTYDPYRWKTTKGREFCAYIRQQSPGSIEKTPNEFEKPSIIKFIQDEGQDPLLDYPLINV